MGFSAAGFFGQVNANITDKRQYVRARVDEDRLYLREQGLKRQAGIQEQRGQYEQAARSLTNRGADERRVLNFLENNPSGLMELYRRTDNDNDITGAKLNDMMVIGEDYQSEATMDEILNSILPTMQAMPNDTNPVESRRRSIASWLGLDTEDALSNEVYNQQIVGGMTGDQILASMNLPIQAEGSGTTSATLDLSPLRSTNTLSVTDANAYYARANEEYSVEAKRGELAASLEGATQDEITAINANIAILDSIPNSGPARLNAIFESGLFTIGDNTRDLMSSSIGGQLFGIENFSAGARAALGFDATEESTPAGDPANPNAALDPDAVVETAVTPEVETTAIPRPQLTPEESVAEEDYLKDTYNVGPLTPTYEVASLDELEVTTNNAFAASPEAEAFLFEVDGEQFVVTRDDVTGEGDASVFNETITQGYGRRSREVPLANLLRDATLSGRQPGSIGRAERRSNQSSVEDSSISIEESGISVEEAIADQQMLQAAIVSEDIEQDELDMIIQNFSSRYGENAMRAVVDRALNPSTAQSQGGR
jgi:hypothetical protein